MRYIKSLIICLLILLFNFSLVTVKGTDYDPVTIYPSGFGLLPLEKNDLAVDNVDLVFDFEDKRIETIDVPHETMVSANYKITCSESKTIKFGLPFYSDNELYERISRINLFLNGKLVSPKIHIGMITNSYDTRYLTYEQITSDLVSEDFRFDEDLPLGRMYTISAYDSDADTEIIVEFSKDSKLFYNGFSSFEIEETNNDEIVKAIMTKKANKPAVIYSPNDDATINFNNVYHDESMLGLNTFIEFMVENPFEKGKFVKTALEYMKLEPGLYSYDKLRYADNRIVVLVYDLEIIGNDQINEIEVNSLLVPSIELLYEPKIYDFNYLHFYDVWNEVNNVNITIKPNEDAKYMINSNIVYSTKNDGTFNISKSTIDKELINFELSTVENPEPISLRNPLNFFLIIVGIIVAIVFLPIATLLIINRIIKQKKKLI